MLVLGIDPGTATTGYGVVADDAPRAGNGAAPARAGTRRGALHLLECGVIRTRAGASLALRLHDIHAGIGELIARHRPDVLAVEDVFYARNVRTTVTLGHARGVILLAGAEAGLEIREFAPAEIKKSVVGVGAASKEQVQFMLTRLLRLRSAPHPADAADGVAAAVACLLTSHLQSLVPPAPVAGRDGVARPRRDAR